LAPLEILRDYVEKERTLGMTINFAHLRSGFVDEIWLFGNRISAGMWAEIEVAREMGIRIRPMSKETVIAYGEKYGFSLW
jgi:hypothetical protein